MILPKLNTLKHQRYLSQLPKFSQAADNVHTFLHPKVYRQALFEAIKQAKSRIYLTALYLEHDDAGLSILTMLYHVKKQRAELDICILVDWHRAQRSRIGTTTQNTNADWYCQLAQSHSDIDIPIYGVPINTREALGVLHMKGCIIDDQLIYSGASISDVYLFQHDKYRYDRYHCLINEKLTNTMVNYIQQYILPSAAVHRLNCHARPSNIDIKPKIRQFRQQLRQSAYLVSSEASEQETAVTPLIGLGNKNPLNLTIQHLLCSAEQQVVLCTPYFNLPSILVKNITRLLRKHIPVELIVGDKTANDFYIANNEPFKIIGALPYLYEINLRNFTRRLQTFIDNGLLTIRIWKDQENSFHLKGIWVDTQWQMLTGNNLNPRAWRLDLENAVLLHDPKGELKVQREQELMTIRQHTTHITNYKEIEPLQHYPLKVRTLLRRLRRTRIDRLINRIL